MILFLDESDGEGTCDGLSVSFLLFLVGVLCKLSFMLKSSNDLKSRGLTVSPELAISDNKKR